MSHLPFLLCQPFSRVPTSTISSPIPILLINLKRRGDRLAAMQKRLAGIEHVVIEAVDGHEWEPGPQIVEPIYPLTTGELATAESHKKAHQYIVDHQIPYACILEDDVILSPDFGEFMQNPSWIPKDSTLIKVETIKYRVWIDKSSRDARQRQLRELHSYHPGCAGYIVSLESAKKLIEFFNAPDQSPDDLVFKRTLGEAGWSPILQVDPALCIQEYLVSDNYTPSDLEVSRDLARKAARTRVTGIAKILRELKRPLVKFLEKRRRSGQQLRVVEFR